MTRHQVQSGYNLSCKQHLQRNQLKLQPNALINVQASTVIKYTNLEHGQLKHQNFCQEGTDANAAVLKCIPTSPALLHCTNFQYHLNIL